MMLAAGDFAAALGFGLSLGLVMWAMFRLGFDRGYWRGKRDLMNALDEEQIGR